MTKQAIIYLRTSTDDQDPQNQLKACQNYAEREGYNVVDTYVEYGSAWKDQERPKYQEIRSRVAHESIDGVIVWAFDRWIRNWKQLKSDLEYLRSHDVALESVQEDWVDAMNIDGAMGEAIRDTIINLLGALAERESNLKSQRVQAAAQNYDGDDWGRPTIRDKIRDDVLRLHHEGKSQREIARTVTYYDENRNEQTPSRATVRRIIKDNTDGS